MAQIDVNCGLIIGTTEYQQFIEKNYFNLLIKEKICNKTLVEYSNDNIIKKYYIYKCNQIFMNGKILVKKSIVLIIIILDFSLILKYFTL